MDDQSLLRYNRQIMLPEIDIDGQKTLLSSHVMIIGLGGLGSPVAMYLASAGIGKLTLVDFDEVDLSNLQRQIIHNSSSIGSSKTESAKRTIQALNPNIEIVCLSQKQSAAELEKHLHDVNALVDCSDNFTTRYALNSLALNHKIPLISGAAVGFDGQVTLFDFRKENSPCYECLFPKNKSSNDENLSCSENGVLGPIVGIIGSFQALEVCKLLVNIGTSLCGKLLVFDGKNATWKTLKITKDNNCSACSKERV